jgi:P27 family predicted phage terminase small subunit
MTGRKPKPIAIKILEGNPGKRPINGLAPNPDASAPKSPRWMSKEAKREWRRIVPHLARLKLMSDLDVAVLAMYCETYAQYIKAAKFIQEHGQTYTVDRYDKEGRLYDKTCHKYPEVGIMEACMDNVRKFASLFGLSPSDRARMVVPGAQEDEDEIFFKPRVVSDA